MLQHGWILKTYAKYSKPDKKKENILWSPGYEIPRTVILTDAASTSSVTMAYGIEELGSYCVIGVEF